MSFDLLSSSWYRVAELRPRLRSHVRIHRHHYRGELWYVLEDRVSRRMHRFNAVAHYLIGLMNGRRTVQEIWDAAIDRFGDDAPTQDETIRLLGQLHAAEVLQSEVTPDIAELLRRARKGKPSTWMQNLRSPLAIRVPLFDPDAFLERWLPWYRALFGWAGLVLWCAVVGWGATAAVTHWDALSQDFGSRVLAPQNLLLMWLIFPVLKLFHEFGHACATKAWGGEVHEMGIMFLVLMPIPYVDASSASAFRKTHRRVLVGAAGMVVELFIASLALFLWLEAQPGLFRAALYNVMLIAGISTVLFNANPLLRFDGYYILGDLLQIQNLRQRGQQYLAWLAETKLFGLKQPEFEATRSEKRWFVAFTIASFLYRIFIMLAIAIFIASEYMIVGVLLALWALATGVFLPLAKGVGFLLFHAKLRRNRVRALAATSAILGVLAALLFALPVPYWTRAEGVIWVPHDAQVRAGADGFVRRIVAEPGSIVGRGSPLLVSDNPELAPRIKVLEAQLRLLEVRAQAELIDNRTRREMTLEEIAATRQELEHARRLHRDLTVLSPTSGTFVLSLPAQDLPDRFLRKGQEIGYVVPAKTVTARVLVSQDDIDLVRSGTEAVRVKLAGRLYETFHAELSREVPAASNRLSNLALSSAGGGPAALDPQDSREPRALETWFEYELALPATHAFVLGEHVYARFEHGAEPVAWRIYRSVRQLFLRQFAV
ncbi:MAG: PqqD family peptide modification chaperone [Betaproteobacteria bacterium]|nr:PqqD family peptide modification chaperone [Betaproteobacteria bacterium]MDH5222057.1 PqqD family peptide modification chaperone [Betaproteobacteria bacterium]MDH5350838.1 PqqD family peptide modification chaperone [Betaproteobacteria bacterium]